jgi:hypothetical protein
MLKLLVKIILSIAVAIVAWPITSEAEVFENVDQATWECMKANSIRDHGTKYTSEYPAPGQTITRVGLLDYVVAYKFDPSKNTVDYTMVKTHLADLAMWNGIRDSIAACRK